MAIFKCKMCGGTIEFEQGATVGVCDSCGTKQTLPRLDDDKKANLYDRANHFRRNNDFDKAMSIYEQILNEDNTDAEAYWSLVLCRYGIEYVEDPATHKRIPTVNRAQFTSIYMDEDYKSALQYADGYQKTIYEEEAKAIDEIQKGILEISSKEEPFDVFICYKETDANGRRTQDSVLANDLYHQLTQEGFKVFFSRITLEDKLGTAYEPYIFAALNSSKVMVVLGTKPEYFNAVWVKNEWSRYLALIKNGAKKMIIPAYRDMDPYDLPEEFSHLQAQDMSKLGFMQDLIRGIKKIVGTDAPKATVKETSVANSDTAATIPLLERAFMFLEDGRWQDANIYCEKVLDIDPKNAEAYLGKLMAELQVKTRKALADCAEPFDDKDNYSKVIRFGDEKLENEMRGYIAHIIYHNAVRKMNSADSESAYKSAADIFKTIPGFKDADTLFEQCLERARVHKKKIDIIAKALLSNPASYKQREEQIRDSIKSLEKAIVEFPQTIEKISLNKETVKSLKERKSTLLDERARLGIFKGKEKRVIDGELTEIDRRIFQSEAETTELEQKIREYKTEENIKSELKKKQIELDGIISEKNLNSADSMSFECAMSEIKNNPRIGEEVFSLYPKLKILLSLHLTEVGKTVFFGKYEQFNKTFDGKEDIEWIVLAKENGRALLISKYALDGKAYNTSYTNVTWEICTLRKWLNNDFINSAFTTYEKTMISTVTVSADKNPKRRTNPGNTTTDKVFLLSITEAEKYFTSDEARKCAPTAYAKVQGAKTTDEYKTASGEDTCWWWLRSPGSNQYSATAVYLDGGVNWYGPNVNNDIPAVRPALWIDLNS